METDLHQGYLESIALLKAASSPNGFLASKNPLANYARIWTRDATITGLAALLSGEEGLLETFRLSIITMFEHQHKVGFMPSNVEPRLSKISYGGTVGRTDNIFWAPLGLLSYSLAISPDLASKYEQQVRKCFALADAWEYNGRGLVYTPQSGDWADEYVQHGYILYNQLLRVWALELAARIYHDEKYAEKALHIRKLIEINFWKNPEPLNWYSANMKHQMKDINAEYWCMGFNPSRMYSPFDLQANSLALLLGMGNEDQQQSTLGYLSVFLEKQQNMLPSFSPVLREGDILYEDLKTNYAYEFRNFEHEFHNGGLWQVWNGWLAAAFVKYGRLAEARKVLDYINQSNLKNPEKDGWGFYENCHGLNFKPIGVKHCTWSASGQIIAYQYVNGKTLMI